MSNEKIFEGSVFNKVGDTIVVGCISEEARELIDVIMEEWDKFSGHLSQPTSHYQFAYWLVRWSGLIQPTTQNIKSITNGK